jgi:branched-chain amino acid transport system substrate-binding protein
MRTKYMGRRHLLGTTVLGALAASCGFPLSVFAQSADTIRIGALLPLTGAGAVYGPAMQQAIKIAVDEVNAAGGAAQRKLEILVEDDQTQPEAGVLAAKKLIDVNKVQAIIGTWASSVTLAVMPLTLKADIIEMNTSGAPEISTLDDKDLVWRYHPTNEAFATAFAAVCKQAGFKKAALMAFNNAFGLALTDGFRKAWERQGGTIVERVVYEGKRPSYRSEVQQVLAAKPDVVVMGSYLPDTTIIVREAFQLGGNTNWIMPSWSGNDQLLQALGKEATEGIIVMDTMPNEDAASFKRFSEAYQKAAGDAPNFFSALAYDMVITIALAAEAAGKNATAAEINNKIRTIANPPGKQVFGFAEGKVALEKGDKINYEGASGVLDFDKYGDVAGNYRMSVIQSGKVVPRGRVASSP